MAATTLFLPLTAATSATSAAAAATHHRRADPVTISITSISPSVPQPSTKPEPLRVQLELTNNTGAALKKVHVLAQRGEPITDQRALDAALAGKGPATGEVAVPAKPLVSVDLAAGASTAATFTTSTSILNSGHGLCLCAENWVYPLYFTAHTTDSDGADSVLGTAPTYIPSFYAKPKPVQVSWVWPLIDRPHRLLDETVFTDDDLTDSVSDGRLSRALEVVERIRPNVPITLVLDPELLDELEVMASGHYSVRADGGAAVAGRGQAAAEVWLGRLKSLLQSNANIQVDLTPYADPDVQSLTKQGLTWSASMPPSMRARVTDALGGRPADTDIAWPSAGTISSDTLDALARDGARTVLLNSAAVVPRTDSARSPATLATLRTPTGPVAAALASAAIQKLVRSTVSLGATGTASLPQLVAELAVRTGQASASSHVALLAPPRYVDPSPDNAVRTIDDTSSSTFASPIALRAVATSTAVPTAASKLAKVPAKAARLPTDILDNASAVRTALPTVTALIGKSTDAKPLLAALPKALQRTESSAWRADSTQGGPATGTPGAQKLAAQVSTILGAVKIVSPSSGSYTLGSSNSALPITVENDSDYTAQVIVRVNSIGGVTGFSTKLMKAQPVVAHSKQTLKLPTRIDRSGRIQVQAQLSAPNGAKLGRPVGLTVHSTVLGTIGVVITIVAGAILALALLVRLLTRLRARRKGPPGPRRSSSPTGSPPDPDPVPVPVPVPVPDDSAPPRPAAPVVEPESSP